MICNSILDAIGNTPIIRLNQLSEELDINVYSKLESLNPGGSHKVRIALGMIKSAEDQGVLVRGTGQTLLEPSGGNTGVGLAMAANLLGYKLVLVIPDNYSLDKQKILKLYGAKIVLSDSTSGNNSHGEKAIELQLENPDFVMLNQQRNKSNPETHKTITANEIFEDFKKEKIDYFVSGICTGGHITGLGEAMKNKWKDLEIFGVEPDGCSLLENKHANHKIQGLSVGIIPDVLNVSILDSMINVGVDDCVKMVMKIMRSESISLGISSAANFVAITNLVKKGNIKKKSNVLTLTYDGVESYLNYF